MPQFLNEVFRSIFMFIEVRTLHRKSLQVLWSCRDTAALEQNEYRIKTRDHKQAKNYRKITGVLLFVKGTIRFQQCLIVTSILDKEY